VRVTHDLTEVVDEVEAGARKHILWGPVGLAMWIAVPLLFASRGWRTRHLLVVIGKSVVVHSFG
jgi:hypothetical protein